MKSLRAETLALPGIEHGFFGRDGGLSQGLYASLNCGPGSKDDPAAVTENRRRVMAALGAERLVSLAQIHSPMVYTVGANWDAARHPEGDGMVTATPGIALGILTADCAPVLFADPKARVVGAAHAGWKGALGGVLEATLGAMEQAGAARKDITAAIGPCISQESYEVGADFRARFALADPDNQRFFTPANRADHYQFALEGYIAARLAAAGIRATLPLSTCTYPVENGYFSFRRTTHRGELDYGREISAILLKK
jgi:polyphenol oxidase